MLIFAILIILKYIILIVIYGVCVRCSPSISDIVINDLRSAFSMIANDSQQLNNLLQKMYDLQNSTPVIIFNIPMTHECNKRIQMQRRNFMTPTFPNLTKHFMHQMKEKAQYITTSHTDWSILGLEGWTGKLTSPADNDDQRKNNKEFEYPKSKILQALNQPLEVSSVPSTAMTRPKWHKENVYIARANNPFGYSEIWQQTNKSIVSHDDDYEDRKKRDVANLYSMIKCATGCNPLVYQGHGCFCGFLGSGTAEDGVDRCCQQHDKCYSRSNCINFIEYFVPYVWKCFGKPVCAIAHGPWGGENSCAARLCHCDLQLSLCLRKHVCPKRRAACSSSQARRLQNFLFVS